MKRSTNPIEWGIQLIAGTGCPELATAISRYLDLPLSGVDIVQFPNENLFVHCTAAHGDRTCTLSRLPPGRCIAT